MNRSVIQIPDVLRGNHQTSPSHLTLVVGLGEEEHVVTDGWMI